MARLLYTGPHDDRATYKRFEDEEIEAALQNGWRLLKVDPDAPGEVERTGDRNPEPVVDAKGDRLDGPTLEEYVGRGYLAENYPPSGYAEQPSEGLTAFRAQQAQAAEDAAAEAAKKAADANTAPADEANASKTEEQGQPKAEGNEEPTTGETPTPSAGRGRRK